MMAGIANEVAAISQDLVTVGPGARHFGAGLAAIDELDAGDDLAVRDVGVAGMVEDNALAILRYDEDLDGLDVLGGRQVGGDGQRGRQKRHGQHGC